jgi:hypothetical protein
MHRQSAHQTGESVSDSRRRCCSFEPVVSRAQNLRCQHKQNAGSIVKIGLKRRPVGHYLRSYIEQARIDEAGNALAGKCMVAYRRAQRIGDGLARRFALTRLLYGLSPPLQANCAEVRLAYLLGDPRKLDVEGVKGEEIVTRVTRGKQSGQRPARIAGAGDASYCVATVGLMQS